MMHYLQVSGYKVTETQVSGLLATCQPAFDWTFAAIALAILIFVAGMFVLRNMFFALVLAAQKRLGKS